MAARLTIAVESVRDHEGRRTVGSTESAGLMIESMSESGFSHAYAGFERTVIGRGIGFWALLRASELAHRRACTLARAEPGRKAAGIYEKMGARLATEGVTFVESQIVGPRPLELGMS